MNQSLFTPTEAKDYVIEEQHIKKALKDVSEKIKHYQNQQLWLKMMLKMSKEYNEKTKTQSR